MSFRDEDILILNRAGLTISQAKIFLTLAVNGKQTIRSVAKLANIDRSNASREILKLQEMALVKKTISVPNMYETISFQDGLSILAEHKEQQYEKTRKELKELLQNFSCNKGGLLPEDEKSLFIIPKKTSFMKSSMQQMKMIQRSNDTISSLKRFSQAMDYGFFKIHQSALERGVRTRVILEKPESEKFLIKQLRTLMEYPNFQLRYTLNPPEALGSCFDNKRLAIIIDPLANVTESPLFAHITIVL